LGEPIGRPVLFDRGYGKYQNPFPPSTLRGYNNIIFEVKFNFNTLLYSILIAK
jgi:hypothetical protein